MTCGDTGSPGVRGTQVMWNEHAGISPKAQGEAQGKLCVSLLCHTQARWPRAGAS